MSPLQMGRMGHVSRSKGANPITNYLQKRDMKCNFIKE